MTSQLLENLVASGSLKREAPSEPEYNGLLKSGITRLKDASNESLSLESRFDLAYNAAHARSLAALRRLGLRAGNRYIVFQVLEHTAGIPSATWRVVAKAHAIRNEAEYEGHFEVDAGLLADTITAAQAVLRALQGAR